MATVTARGTGLAVGTPREAQLALTVSVLDEAPDVALQRAAALDAELRSALDELAIPPAARTTAGATLREEQGYDQKSQQPVRLGFRALITTRVRLDDPAKIGTLMKEAATRAQAQIAGPWWQIPPDDPSYRAACEAAAVDAKGRAEAYARALGLGLGQLVSLTESSPARMPVMPVARALAADSSPEPDVSAGGIQVEATVEATYELTGAGA